MIFKIKTIRYLAGLLVLLSSFIYFSLKPIGASNLAKYSAGDLAGYNGDNPDKPVYLALNGYVYDVSPGRSDFYNPGKSYHYLAGKDSSSELNLFGGNIIKRKYKVVGIYSP